MTTGNIIELNPREFFQKNISQALGKQKLQVSQDVEFYLVNLLCDFIEPNKIANIDLFETPLALIHKAAVEAPPDVQVKLFKNLGDTSLYISGYFQDFFNKKAFSIDYYMTLGSNAYINVSSLVRDKGSHFSDLYMNLADNFHVFVEVVAEVRDQINPGLPTDLISTYEMWTRTQSNRLRLKLEKSGIHPIPGSTQKQ